MASSVQFVPYEVVPTLFVLGFRRLDSFNVPSVIKRVTRAGKTSGVWTLGFRRDTSSKLSGMM